MDDEGNMATASPSLGTPQKNPVLIDLILESTLSNLSLKDLLSCRLVCQQWNRISTPKVKEKCTELDFTAWGLNSPLPSYDGDWNYFLPTMKNSLSIPCTKFKFQLDSSNPDLTAFQEIIDLCPNEITSHHLRRFGSEYGSYPCPGPDTNKATFQNWLKKLKNLTKLTITDFEFGITSCSTFFEPGLDLSLDNLREFHFLESGTQGGKPCSGFFDGFFKAAQNLEKMSFGVIDYRQEYEKGHPRPDDFKDSSDEEEQLEEYKKEHAVMYGILEMNEGEGCESLDVVLHSLLNHGLLDRIKSLTFHILHPINLATLVKIGKKGLKLESFQVRGRLWFDPIKYYQFLETQKDTLKALVISGGGESPKTLGIRFLSQMKELRRLTLSNNGPLIIYEQQPICYTDRFPKIKRLRVRSGHRRRDYRQDIRILDIFLSELENLVGCETLKELRMFFTLSDDEPRIEEDEIIQRVSRIFPEIVIRVRIDPAEEADDDEMILENGRVREMTLKIFGD